MTKRYWHSMGITAILALVSLTTASAESSDYVLRDFVIDAALLSYVPGEGIDTYEQHGSGMATAGATLGLGLQVDDSYVSVDIRPRVEEGRFLVTIDLEPKDVKEKLGFKKQELDLTEVKPLAVPLAAFKQGRVYQLNITPSVRVTDSTPKRLDVNKLRLHNWRFPDSPILVNDALYVGRISCSQSPLAFVDISGIAFVEFSLHQLTDSQPWGVLQNGIVTLANPEDHTTIQISNVHNGGPYAVDLPGGPYQVWVRWSKPSRTLEQHRTELIKLREKIAAGEIPNASTDYLDKQLAREPSPWVYSCGVRGLRSGDDVIDAN